MKTILLEEKSSLFYFAWTFLLLLNIIGFILTGDFSDELHIAMFKAILACMLPFYPFYYFAKKDELKRSHLIRFCLILLPVMILQFFLNRSQVLLERVTDDLNIVNNSSYLFVNLLPFVFLFKKKTLFAGVLIVLMIFFIIQGAKRGAIISGAIGFIMYTYYQLKTIERQNKIRGYIFTFFILFGVGAYAYRTFMSNEFLINRMNSISEGNSSGRDLIYKAIYTNWYNSESIWNFLSGFGFAGSLELTGRQYAHNDWLELLSNFGLIGITVYMLLFYAAIRQILNKEWMEDKRVLMLTITFIWFFISLVSMWYTSMSGIPLAILLGYLLGTKNMSIE